jgi:hypothetical protein
MNVDAKTPAQQGNLSSNPRTAGIANRLRQSRQKNCGSIPCRKDSSASQRVQNSRRTPPTSIQCVQRTLSRGVTLRDVETTNILHLLLRVRIVSTITHNFVVCTGPTLPLPLAFFANIHILYSKAREFMF